MTQQLQGTFLSLSENVNEQKGQKYYDFFKVNYRDAQGNNKTYSGFQNALKYNRELANNLRKLQQGSQIILVIGKNKAGYDELQAVSVVSSDPGNGTRAVATPNNDGPRDHSPAPARSYQGESAEERAKRQILIVKQSSLSSAVETVKQDKKVPTTEEVLSVAQEYFNWVMSEGSTKEVQQPQESPARGPTIDLEDDIPF